MAAEYQHTDLRVADYGPFCLDEKILDRTTGRPLLIRGPRPLRIENAEYVVCIGAAQTFGRFCQRPFPAILQDRLSMPVLNISHGGAGPTFFGGNNERLLQYLNGARLVVIQVMSGRSNGNSLFESAGVGCYRRKSDGLFLSADQAFEELIQTAPREVLTRIVEETRQGWCASYEELLSKIRVPKILFWFATRRPAYKQGWRSVKKLFGSFPQLVNEEMIGMIRQRCDFYVQCTSNVGLPHPLKDRLTGESLTISDPWTSEPWTENWYYPSPEMHVEAADALEASCWAASRMNSPGGLSGLSSGFVL